MENTILALDLGPNSIGWVLASPDAKGEPNGIVATGVRIFQEAVDEKTRIPKNAARRRARGARRLLHRRRVRMNELTRILVSHGLLPADGSARDALFHAHDRNPYILRARALEEPLTLHEIGRALFHLCRRRGFKSNRKAQLGDVIKDPEIRALVEAEDRSKKKPGSQREKDEGEVKKEIAGLRASMRQANCRTLGEYFAREVDAGRKVRTKHTDRTMYEEEFEAIWDAQRPHHRNVLTDALKAEIFHVIFFQRPLRNQKFLVGPCRFEPNRKRASRGLVISHDFRLWQDINNILVKDPHTLRDRPLTQAQRHRLFDRLHEQKEMSWAGLRRLLGLQRDEEINLEEGKKEHLLGNLTWIDLHNALGEKWDDMSDTQREALQEDLITIDDKGVLLKHLRGRWQFTPEEAYKVATIELLTGFMSISVKAMRKLLPHLSDGFTYYEACGKAGYQDEKALVVADRLGDPPEARNPVVSKALFETRRVVNHIVRAYGKPAVVRVEMARDMKLTKKQKEAVERQNRENKKRNDEADQKVRALGLLPGPDLRLKYRLWVESDEMCPYTGQVIGLGSLFGEAVDVEHIIPYSRCLDDSFGNKTLCAAHENRQVKKNRTPHEAYSGNHERYQEILRRVHDMRAMSPRKKRLFEQTEVKTDDFVERQLNDTRYICVLVKDYLKTLGSDVQVTRGEATAVLRRLWGLNNVLPGTADPEHKSRDDHRHHAVDAAVIACSTRSLFHRLSALSGKGGSLSKPDFAIPEPWPSFRREVADRVGRIVVSHSAMRKVAGPLHEETVYGPGPEDGTVVYRKPVAALTAAEIGKDADSGKIRDVRVRRLIQERVAEFGDARKALGDEGNPITIPRRRGGDPIPVRSVRLVGTADPVTMHTATDDAGRPIRSVALGSNHHAEILQHVRTGERKAVFVSAMEAARRARTEKKPVVQRDHGADWRFVMWLCRNDIVALTGQDAGIYRVANMSFGQGFEVRLRPTHVARADDIRGQVRIRSRAGLRDLAAKLSVDPLGNLTPCND